MSGRPAGGRLPIAFLAIGSCAWGLPGSLAAQSYLERTPHLGGGWIGLPGVIYMDDWALFRTTAAPGDGLLAMPVYSALLPIPRGLLIGGTLAANARPEGGDVLEVFARVGGPQAQEQDRWAFGLTGGYSRPAGSVDGELSVSKVLGRLRVLAAARGYSDLDGRGARGAILGGVLVPVAPGRLPLALAGDMAQVLNGSDGFGPLWSVGLHAGLPFTPFTVALQASNARDPGFQGSALEAGRLHFGVAVMSPIPLGRFLGSRGQSRGSIEGGVDAVMGMARASISRHAYWPARITVPAGTVIEWVNDDSALHTVTAHDTSFGSEGLSSGGRWRARFDAAGTYLYQCGMHPFMQAVVIVR